MAAQVLALERSRQFAKFSCLIVPMTLINEVARQVSLASYG